MSKMRRGFTLIEVALFLAVTGLLFAGVMVGVQNSIWQQRYNDTVQNFANFLRNVYSEVSNPQSSGNGRSEELAIYGKLISFGEINKLSCDLIYLTPVYLRLCTSSIILLTNSIVSSGFLTLTPLVILSLVIIS